MEAGTVNVKSGIVTFRKRKMLIWALLAVGFGAVEFPGILFAGDKIYPRIFGLPFLYGYVLCCWIYICLVLIYAWKTRWGRVSFFQKEPYLKRD
jgi:uncharacterized membrane protein